MEYAIETIPDRKIVRVTVHGSLDQKTRKQVHLQATSELIVNDYHRLLIDVRRSVLSPHYTIGDSLDMTVYMREIAVPDDTRIAYLSARRESARQNFVQTAYLWGGINIMHFHDQDAAIEWLCAE